MLRLRRITPPQSADVFAKLEYLNPGGSVKDRAAIGIIQTCRAQRRACPGGVIVEATAGNTGIGLALIGVNRGYKVALFVPERFSEEKVIIMRALGAEVTRTPDDEGMLGAIARPRNSRPRLPARSWPCNSIIPRTLTTISKLQQKKFSSRWKAISTRLSSAPERPGLSLASRDI